jgi:anti-sigma factor RsiW
MKTCRDIVDLLSDYIDGQLDPATRGEFEVHMKDCRGCLDFLASLRSTCSAVRALTCNDIPAGVHRALRTFLDREIRRDQS